MPNKIETTVWTNEEITTLLAQRLRPEPRPMPWALVAKLINHTETECERMLWGIATGYGGHDADGPRLTHRHDIHGYFTGRPWTAEHRRVLALGRGVQAQRRRPPVDTEYIAAVLGRTVEDVEEFEKKTNLRTGMKGFF